MEGDRRGGGFGEYYWLVGRRAVESDLGGIFGCGGGRFSRGGRGEFGAWSVSPSAVPRVSEEASRSAFHLREPCAGPNVWGAMRPRQECCECTAFFPFKLGASPPKKKLFLRVIHRYYY